MTSDEKRLIGSFSDTSEAKRKYGGGRVMMPSDMGLPSADQVLSESMGGAGAATSDSSAKITHKRGNYAPYDPKKKGKPGQKPPKLDTLKDYISKQTDEYFPRAEAVVSPEDYDDFTQDYKAQTDFGHSAALQEYIKKASNQDHDAQILQLPNGKKIGVFVFGDGSQYYVNPDVKDISNLRPGNVIRIEPPGEV